MDGIVITIMIPTMLTVINPPHTHTASRRYEQLLSDSTKRGMPVPGLVSAAQVPYVQSMTSECLSPACTERCTLRGVGNLTVAEEMEGLTGFYVGLAGWDYG